MRYRKGCISLNAIEDEHILRYVMLARYVSHEQLRALVGLHAVRSSRSTFNWRVARLVKHEFLKRHAVSVVPSGMAYSIGPIGMEYLSVRGECFTQKNQRQARDCTGVPGSLLHSLGVNDLHLRMHLDGVLARWKWETQIRAQNELTTVRYAKDYDAIVTVRIGHDEAEFALEYEGWRRHVRGTRTSVRRSNRNRTFNGLFMPPQTTTS